MATADPSETRYERRKRVTRAKISDAATRLFMERGYEDVSMADIAAAADVAVRTIYLHFDSKAAMALDYIDRWTERFVDLVIEQDLEAPLDEVVANALRGTASFGFPDLPFEARYQLQPTALSLSQGPPEVAGHMVQRWMEYMERITLAYRARQEGVDAAAAFAPESRAAAVMATWFGSMLVFGMEVGGGRNPGAHGLSSNEVGTAVARAIDPD